MIFHSTRPTADLWSSKSPTMLADHCAPSPSSAPVSRSSLGVGGLTRQIRTCPSRAPVATRWYERPHDGAHAMDVTAHVFAPVHPSPAPAPPDPFVAAAGDLMDGSEAEGAEDAGAGLRLRSEDGRREGVTWMI